MKKFRILHITTGRFVTLSPTNNFDPSMIEITIGDYKTGKIYETRVRYMAQHKIKSIFSGGYLFKKELPGVELCNMSITQECEFAAVEA